MMMVIGGKGLKGEKSSYGKESEEMEESEESEGLSGMTRKRATKDILAAIESGDASMLDKALSAHYEACQEE